VAEVDFFIDIQKILHRERETNLPKSLSRICAVDAAYDTDCVVAVASVFDGGGRLLEKATYSGSCSLPYVSGLFYLREGPSVTEAVRRLSARPQLLCFDAHGAAHPRSAGLATVAGMILGIPSIGIAKSLLLGEVARGEGGLDRIIHDKKTIGFVTGVQGVKRYWSAGYSVDLRRLKSLVRRYEGICILAMSESDKTAKEQIRLVTK